MAKFNIMDILNSNSKQVNDDFNIRMLNVFDIKDSNENFYNTDNIDELAESIEMFGIQQNLVVRELADGTNELIAGHRRKHACIKLVNEGKEEFKYVPCKIEKQQDDLREKLLLIHTNSTARELTDYEKVEQARILKELLIEYKKEHNVPGRIRDLVADTLNISPTQIARMDSISNNLSEELKKEFKEEKINISTAYELSGLDKDIQKEIYDNAKVNDSSELDISIKDIKDRKVELKEQIIASIQEKVIAPEEPIRTDCTYDSNISCNIHNAKLVAESLGVNCEYNCCTPCEEDCGARCYYSSRNRTEEVECCNQEDDIKYEDELDQVHIDDYPEYKPEDVEDDDIVQAEPLKPLFSAMRHLKDAIKREEEQIALLGKSWAEKQPDTLLKHQTLLIALKLYLTDMEYPVPDKTEPVKVEQPELPILKNNDQRKEFIDNYTSWPIWISTEQTGERYYKYDFCDDNSIVVRVSMCHKWIGYGKGNDGYSTDAEYSREEYYLLEKDKCFAECSTNKSVLVEYLKELQKD